MSRLTETEREQMARAKVGGFEQIARREQATERSPEQIDRSALSERNRVVEQGARGAATRLTALVRRTVPGLVRQVARARVRNELAGLDNAMLRDLGITRTEIERVAREQSEREVPRRPGKGDAPLFRSRPHSAEDIARYA